LGTGCGRGVEVGLAVTGFDGAGLGFANAAGAEGFLFTVGAALLKARGLSSSLSDIRKICFLDVVDC
jgi:hypothetical protein